MGNLILGTDFDVFPSGKHRDEMERMAASIQTWAGKQDADGRWIAVPFNASDFLIEGAGNSWTVNRTPTDALAYTIIGDTMCLNIAILSSALIASGSATPQLSIRLPDGFLVRGRLVGTTVVEGRSAYNMCYLLDNVTQSAAVLQATAATPYIRINKITGANLTDGACQLVGQIVIEVTRQ